MKQKEKTSNVPIPNASANAMHFLDRYSPANLRTAPANPRAASATPLIDIHSCANPALNVPILPASANAMHNLDTHSCANPCTASTNATHCIYQYHAPH